MTERTFLLWNLNIILESLPVSSSGHVRVFQQLASSETFTSTTIPSSLEHLMHIPNALVLCTFMALHLYATIGTLINLLIPILLANLITGITYLILKKHTVAVPLWAGFLLSALTLLSLFFLTPGTATTLTFSQGVLIGGAQALSLLPGISRMAMTVTAALWLGVAPLTSFIMSLLCELLLILVAVATAWASSTSTLWPLTPSQLSLLSITSFISLAALYASSYAFSSGNALFFGVYLVGIASYLWYTKK